MEEKEKLNVKANTQSESWMSTIGRRLINEHIVPTSRDIMHDMFARLINMVADTAQAGLNDEFKKIGWKGSTSNSSSNKSYNTFYSSGSSSNNTTITSTGSRIINLNDRSATNVKLIFVNSSEDAEKLTNFLKDNIDRYKRATVAELYEQLDPPIPSTFMDTCYGWNGQSSIGYKRIFTGDYGEENRGKYMLDLSTPIDIRKI